jgi:hypothetical protein
MHEQHARASESRCEATGTLQQQRYWARHLASAPCPGLEAIDWGSAARLHCSSNTTPLHLRAPKGEMIHTEAVRFMLQTHIMGEGASVN